ncbi:MAG: SDR family oxidoreductase [Amphiplicatus sp.]
MMMSAPHRGAALVTGAGKRLGRAMALALAKAGYDVALHFNSSGREARKLADLLAAEGRRSALLKADLAREDEVAPLIGEAKRLLGPLRLLVNSASVFEEDDIETMTRESWERHIAVNLRAPLRLAQDFARAAEAGKDALIVNMLDQRVLKPTPQFLSYSTSKAALFALTKTLAQALGPRNIRVNAIGPGPTLRNPRQSEKDWRRQNAATVLGRGAEPGDIAGALLYLIDATAVTGQMIAVDGGQHLAWKTGDVLVKE